MIVELIFHLDEDVTPAIFVQRVATACAKGGALRVGESVAVPHSLTRWEVAEPEELDEDSIFPGLVVPSIREVVRDRHR
jgi:hypothetical protein